MMADKKEYIERGALLKTPPFTKYGGDLTSLYTEGYLDCAEDARMAVKCAPAADVVEVVRCKDCEYREELLDRVMCRRTAHKSANGWFGLRATADKNFCSYGERKEQT